MVLGVGNILSACEGPRPLRPIAFTRRVCSQRLEGSRFGVYLAERANFVPRLILRKRVKTSGSRERPSSFAALWPGENES
jgi:hypothetical protein